MRPVRRRTGIAAVTAGAGFFAGQAGELVFGSPSDLVDIVFLLLVGLGFAGLALALWDLRAVVVEPVSARVGLWMAMAGAVVLLCFAVQVLVVQARTGDVPHTFLLFAVGFLLVLVGQVLFAPGLLGTELSRAWPLPVLATLGLVVGLGLDVDPVHDVGLLVFEGAWVGFGVVLLRGVPSPKPVTGVHPRAHT